MRLGRSLMLRAATVGSRGAAMVPALLMLMVGCDLIVGDQIERQRMIATIAYFGDSVVIALPDTVDAHELFEVHVRTYGGGCVDEGDTEVDVNGLVATVTPYDIEVTHLPDNHVAVFRAHDNDSPETILRWLRESA